jgi:hypothetical protein
VVDGRRVAHDVEDGALHRRASSGYGSRSLLPQILYLDAFRLERGSRELKNDHVMTCMSWLRSHERYRYAGIVYACENLPGSNGAELAYQMRHVPHSISMAEFGTDKRPGVPKTVEITETMVMRMRRLLNTDSLHFAADLGTYANAPEPMIDQLCDQLLAFQRVPMAGNSTRFRWTGKHGLSGRDDLAVAALMPAYWSEVFYDSPDYDTFRRETNQYIAYLP